MGAKRKRAAAPKRAKPKARPKPKPKRVDWSKRKAPPKSSKLRADYERSAVAKKRRKTAAKGQATKRTKTISEQRRLARRERVEAAKELLGPLLERLISAWKDKRLWRNTRGDHANWYREKMRVKAFVPERDYFDALEEMADEYDVDELGWDIIY